VNKNSGIYPGKCPLDLCSRANFYQEILTSPDLENMLAEFRKEVAFRNSDLYFKPDLDKAITFVKTYKFET